MSNSVLLMWLEMCRMKEKCLETIMNLHETTEYKVKRREGISKMNASERVSQRISTSLILFNIYHQTVIKQAVIRQALEARRMDGRAEKDVVWK